MPLLTLVLLAQVPAMRGPLAHARSLVVAEADLTRYVDPFTGTGTGHPGYGIGNEGGHVFPGAAYPHGMVQWSPDTTNAAGGYRYTQHTINGFSLTHFSGRGCASYQDFPIMPVFAPPPESPASGGYGARFSHVMEQARPGFYSVRLDDGIGVSLTVTPRSGFAQFSYPALPRATLLIPAGGSATGNDDAGTWARILGDGTVLGSATGGHFCGSQNHYTVYFAAIFDRPFSGYGSWNGSQLVPNGRFGAGSRGGVYVSFATTGHHAVRMKVGISFVSAANALLNLRQENPSWDFGAVRRQAGAAWNTHLHEIDVGGGTATERTIFYTALYHTLFHPNLFSDVDGQYMGFDGRVHTARGRAQYDNFPGWDMYRSLAPLDALLEPASTSEMLQSLVEDAAQGGGGLPRWQVANDNSGGMVGDSPDAVIASSYALGARHFDVHAALAAMDRGASRPGTHSGRYPVRVGLFDYMRRGYVTTTINGSASMTLEYAIDDFALAQFARALGDSALATGYLRRAQNWRRLFNPATGYIQPRHASGSFSPAFDPTSGQGFVEGDAAQYRWLVPFNLRGLFAAMGGNRTVVAMLDTHFRQLNAGPNSPYFFMGNEPELAVPWEYDFAGAPYGTQGVVRRILRTQFTLTSDGLPGNDDGGALSSWFVFAALGLYPEIPGVAGFALGSPLFPQATVHLTNGVLQIRGGTGLQGGPYVRQLLVNGRPYSSPWLPYAAISAGGTLDFTLDSRPQPGWGSAADAAPPSYSAPA